MVREGKYLFIVSMDVDEGIEDLFNEVYDDEHIPFLCKVPGVFSVTRLQKEPLTMSIGGEQRTINVEDEPKYTAIYEISDPEVLVSEDWAKAVEQGRWSTEVRPHTNNRRHVLRQIM